MSADATSLNSRVTIAAQKDDNPARTYTALQTQVQAKHGNTTEGGLARISCDRVVDRSRITWTRVVVSGTQSDLRWLACVESIGRCTLHTSG